MNSRALIVALLISAALNVFVVGAAVGLVLSGGLPAPPTPNPLRAAADRLEPPDRQALLDLLQDQAQANGPVLLDARTARREAKRLLLAQPFDAAATAAALSRARADDILVRGRIEDAVVAFAAKLGPAERARLSAGVMRPQQQRAGLLARLGLGGPPPVDQPPPTPGHP